MCRSDAHWPWGTDWVRSQSVCRFCVPAHRCPAAAAARWGHGVGFQFLFARGCGGRPYGHDQGCRRRRGGAVGTRTGCSAAQVQGGFPVTDAPETRTRVEFRLLGPLVITVDEKAVSLPGAAERALLALLLLSPGRSMTANALIDRLWGDDLPADPSNALQLRVSKLRRALVGTDAAVVRDGVGYRAEVAPGSVDVEAFISGVSAARAHRDGQDDTADIEAAGLYGAALGRWTGEPLADFVDQPWATV